jgi:hypothetical protein
MNTQPTEVFPQTAKLTPLLQERQFLAALLMGLPLLVYAYVEIARAIISGAAIDVAGVGVALAANPVTIYLAARQYPRGKAAEAIGVQLQPLPGPVDPSGHGFTEADLEEVREALHAGFGIDPDGPTVRVEDNRIVFNDPAPEWANPETAPEPAGVTYAGAAAEQHQAAAWPANVSPIPNPDGSYTVEGDS